MSRERYGILNKTVVPINLKPNDHSEMADEGLYGMVVKILEELEDNWFYVETHYQYHGYIHGDNMIMDEEGLEEWTSQDKKIIYHGLADVLPEASYKGYIKQVLTRGAQVIASGLEEEGWAEVILANGEKGWLRRDFLGEKISSYDREKEEEIRESLVETAMKYWGSQYRWGGKSPLGLDCSGLCSISYMLNGIIIYRDAQLKEDYMRSIDLKEIKKGDLLFFPGHVAMYIEEDKYIHSSSSINGVGINSLNPKDEDYNEYLAKNITGIGTIF